MPDIYYLAADTTQLADYVRVGVTATSDPTGDVVQFAFTDLDTRNTQPVSGDWVTGSWEGNQLPTGEWVARVLIGHGGKTLAVGEYAVWIKIVDSPTVPMRPVSSIEVQ